MNDTHEMTGELVEVRTMNLPSTTPADLLSLAVSKNADMATLERLMDLQDRWDTKQAKNAYTDAMAEFKRNPPEILKRKKVEFSGTKYSHAEIGDVCDAVTSTMAAHGFSHRWDTRQIDGRIEVTCIITHRLGHSESTTLHGSPDDSGRKNAIQQIASTVTYLQRYTLLAAIGLATNSMDDDGRKAGGFDQHGNPIGNNQRSTAGQPISGVWESLDSAQEIGVRKAALKMQEYLDMDDLAGAIEFKSRAGLDADETTAFWTCFKSYERSALKKAHEGDMDGATQHLINNRKKASK